MILILHFDTWMKALIAFVVWTAIGMIVCALHRVFVEKRDINIGDMFFIFCLGALYGPFNILLMLLIKVAEMDFWRKLCSKQRDEVVKLIDKYKKEI